MFRSMTFICIVGFFLALFGPWWTVVVVAFVVGFCCASSGWQAFLSGFLGVALLWGGAAAWFHYQSSGMLTEKIATLLPFPIPILLISMTVLVGGTSSGLGSVTGYQFSKILRSKGEIR